MAVVVWSSPLAGPVAGCRRASGVEVSVAVWRDGVSCTLRFKRSVDGGQSWPPDNQAVTVATLERREPWFICEVGGMLLVGNGINRSLTCLASGEDAEHWQEAA